MMDFNERQVRLFYRLLNHKGETQNSDSLNEECTPHLKLLKAKRILKNKLKKDLKKNSKKLGKKPLKFVKVMIKECYYLKDISTRQYTNH